jgi:hypothetical protein
MTSIRATVSGSFHKHLAEIQGSVLTLQGLGVTVLSPSDPRVVDEFGEFVFVASDRRRTIRGIQNRHLEAIRSSDFLFLVCTDGYVGTSAAMELGYAVAVGTPVFSTTPPNDLTLRQYVNVVNCISDATAHSMLYVPTLTTGLRLLLDPAMALGAAHDELDQIELEMRSTVRHERDPVDSRVNKVVELLSLPAR